jgi:hypothetical protein
VRGADIDGDRDRAAGADRDTRFTARASLAIDDDGAGGVLGDGRAGRSFSMGWRSAETFPAG